MRLSPGHNRGFTAFFAMLTASLALLIGLAIYDLLLRELALSQVAAQSQYAIFAADTGAECALYWDSKAPLLDGATSVFGTSTASTWGSSPVNCNGLDITTKGPPAVYLSSYSDSTKYNCTSSSAWCRVSSAAAATTTFSLSFTLPKSQTSCAIVEVAKYRDPNDPFDTPPQTKVVSHGYNNCSTGEGLIRLERALQVSY